jgi:hypothetical protein
MRAFFSDKIIHETDQLQDSSKDNNVSCSLSQQLPSALEYTDLIVSSTSMYQRSGILH